MDTTTNRPTEATRPRDGATCTHSRIVWDSSAGKQVTCKDCGEVFATLGAYLDDRIDRLAGVAAVDETGSGEAEGQ